MGDINILIAGGGTGGHIIPGLALCEEFKEKNIKSSILIGRKDRRFSPVSHVDNNDLFVYNAPSMTKNIFKIPFFFLNFSAAVLKSIIILKQLKINAVIGMGGFVSAPALIASIILKIPIYLCEQNSVPGKVTLFFAKKAQKIFTTFKMTSEYLNKDVVDNVMHLGNPIRKKLLSKVDKESAKKRFYLKHCEKIILVIGGSQGAIQINELFLNIKKLYKDEFKDIGVIWSSGNHSHNRFKEDLHNIEGDGSTYLSPFIDDVEVAYKASDLAISRSGAGGIMEFAAVGLPSILIPYPYAADDHQEMNAEVFEKSGASIRIRKDKSEPEVVGELLIQLMSNPLKLTRMSKKAKSLSKIHAAADIVDNIIKDLHEILANK